MKDNSSPQHRFTSPHEVTGLDWVADPVIRKPGVQLNPTWWGLTLGSLLRVVGIAVVVVLCAVGAWWLIPQPTAVQVPDNQLRIDDHSSSPSNPQGSPAEGAEQEVHVHVTGEVEEPGLVALAEQSRVADAIEAAGGATQKANLAGVNLAAFIIDGEQIHVPDMDEAVNLSNTEDGEGQGLISINSASVDQLQQLPGIGPVMAERIVEYRDQQGGFSAIEDLQAVPGVGPTIMAEIEDKVRL